MVDALARRCSTPPLVVRHNGGAQAGHNVHTPDGRHHTFSQFGAATFVPGSRTLLSEHMIFHPPALMAENDHLRSIGVKDALQRLMIDARALVITPYHQAINRLRELARGDARHGSCGLGVGETVGDSLNDHESALRVEDLRDPKTLRRKMSTTLERKRLEMTSSWMEPLRAGGDERDLEDVSCKLDRAVEIYEDIGKQLRIVSASDAEFQIRESEHVIFEGAQGVLLDEWHGFHPHTTWSTTTSQRADELIEKSGRRGRVNRIGVVRAYATRHGQGPFPTENTALTAKLRETTNADDGWQGAFRAGWFDAPLARYALGACSGLGTRFGIDSLAVTCLDRLALVPEWSICDHYEWNGYEMDGLRGEPGDLEHQERLGRALGTSYKPILRHVTSHAREYTREIENALGLPIIAMSFGATAEDKEWVSG